MKSIPLLDNYEDVFRLVKSPGAAKDIYLDFSTEEIENYILFRIVFEDEIDSSNYKIESPIHSLHPFAAACFDNEYQTDHLFRKHLQTIEKQLRLTNEQRECFWSNNSRGVQLIIKVYCQFNKDPENLRLVQYCHWLLQNENEIIYDSIRAQTINCRKPAQAQHFIQKTHQSISIFLKKLSDRIKPATINEIFVLSENFDKIDCLKVIYIYGNQILTSLEHDYEIFIDKNASAALTYILHKQTIVKSSIKLIDNFFSTSALDKDLLKIVMLPLQRLNCNLYGKVKSYGEIKYCEQYCAELLQLTYDGVSATAEEELIKFIVSNNLNALHFFKYFCNKVQVRIDAANSTTRKLQILCHSSKLVKQEVYTGKLRFEKNLPPIKEQLINWIEQEAKFLKKEISLNDITPQIANCKEKTKINSGMSVAQIGYFCGLMIRSGIVESENVSELLRVVCENFKTSKSENISHESLRQKYYSVEDATVEAVHEKLLELIKLTKV